MNIRHFHLFCGAGGGAIGFNRGNARVGQHTAKFQCLGGVDSDAAAVKDFTNLVGTRGTVLDMFDREQYTDWHGHEPPKGWREATPADIRKAAGNKRPHIMFTSPPCKGFSGLLSESKSKGAKYQALNRLTLRGIWLALEAWKDDPVEFVLMENVPRIANRGRYLLDQINSLLSSYGYAVAETTHDCGELGGLGQRRKRFLLVARHMAKCPPFLYEPHMQKLKSVGDVLERLPLPGDLGAAGALHKIPNLQWKTWVRLAFVEAGKDWRCLRDLRIEDGYLKDFLIIQDDRRNGALGLHGWDDTAGVIAGESLPSNGKHSVADPRFTGKSEYGQYGVRRWDETMGAVSGQSLVGGGPNAVADPRLNWKDNAHQHKLSVAPWSSTAQTVTGSRAPYSGGLSVADPRTSGFNNKYRVCRWDTESVAVTAGSGPSAGGIAVADPRSGVSDKHYTTGGHYGVVSYDDPSYAVTGHACHDNGPWSIADPRMPESNEKLACIIEAMDGTWHRPFTTYELAALQGLVDVQNQHLTLDGSADTHWRERIGNMVPPPAAQAIASVMGRALLASWTGDLVSMDLAPIWVRPLAIAAAVDVRQ